ncbi:porin [Rubellimicrobium arenae]|uniref:porin n=1 Tax=Rubellimicrobium arenae TaxID=2817372 RepID=UPI001B315E3C|nr:porin [Rubellimicrobium arenae]
MKSILLATASILAFAGAAAADVTFGGTATLGFNDDNGIEPRDTQTQVARDDDGNVITDADGNPVLEEVADDGFFWEVDLGVTLTQELNNGLTAAASFTLNVTDEDADEGGDGSSVDVDDDFLLSLTTENGGLFFGDITFAAESKWDAAGNMLADDFSEADGETVLRGDTIYRGIDASVSAVIADEGNDTPDDDSFDQFSFGAKGVISRFTYSIAYQEESESADSGQNNGTADAGYDPVDENDDFDVSEVFGISAGTTFGGLDAQVAYAKNYTQDADSLGFEVTYPVGPVTLGAYYVLENDDNYDDLKNSAGISADYASGPLAVSAFYEIEDDGNDFDNAESDTDFENDGDDDDEDSNYGLEVAYDSGAGIEVYAGYIQEDGGYVGVEYDLGNGAELIASYADEDEEGAREYEAGTTVAVSLEF